MEFDQLEAPGKH
jgi:hypothetical protein